MNAMSFLEKSTAFRRYLLSLVSYCFRDETPTLSNLSKTLIGVNVQNSTSTAGISGVNDVCHSIILSLAVITCC